MTIKILELYRHSPIGLHPVQQNKRLTVCMIIANNTYSVGVYLPWRYKVNGKIRPWTRKFARYIALNMAKSKNPIAKGEINPNQAKELFKDVYTTLVSKYIMHGWTKEEYVKYLNKKRTQIDMAEADLIHKSTIVDLFYNPENSPKRIKKEKNVVVPMHARLESA